MKLQMRLFCNFETLCGASSMHAILIRFSRVSSFSSFSAFWLLYLGLGMDAWSIHRYLCCFSTLKGEIKAYFCGFTNPMWHHLYSRRMKKQRVEPLCLWPLFGYSCIHMFWILRIVTFPKLCPFFYWILNSRVGLNNKDAGQVLTLVLYYKISFLYSL